MSSFVRTKYVVVHVTVAYRCIMVSLAIHTTWYHVHDKLHAPSVLRRFTGIEYIQSHIFLSTLFVCITRLQSSDKQHINISANCNSCKRFAWKKINVVIEASLCMCVKQIHLSRDCSKIICPLPLPLSCL